MRSGVNGVDLSFGSVLRMVNAGVLVTAYDTGTWAVLAAALVGRPLGILAAVGLALAVGFRLPWRLGWRELVAVALATSSGFTFALFFATSLLPHCQRQSLNTVPNIENRGATTDFGS